MLILLVLAFVVIVISFVKNIFVEFITFENTLFTIHCVDMRSNIVLNELFRRSDANNKWGVYLSQNIFIKP